MTIDNWNQAQWSDAVLHLVIARLQDGSLGQHQLKPTDPPELQQFFHECNHLKLRWGNLYRIIPPKESQEALFQLVLPAKHWETALRGCHSEVGHLGLEWILDLMHDCFFWPFMAAEAREHINKCHPCLTLKAKQPRALLENTVPIHPLELIHLDYLCLVSGKRKVENILVVIDHFTHYTQVYVT